jgi:AAA15 family ATPase/GTPase
MKSIKFLWVEEYQVLKNFGINFSHDGDEWFEFKDGVLTVTKKKPDAFKFGENITGVTAIAGQNGAGKTSVIELLMLLMQRNTDQPNNRPQIKAILCIDKEIFFNMQSLDLELEDPTSYYQCIPTDLGFHNDLLGHYFEYKAESIFYSNVIDFRSYNNQFGRANISSEYLLMTLINVINEIKKDEQRLVDIDYTELFNKNGFVSTFSNIFYLNFLLFAKRSYLPIEYGAVSYSPIINMIDYLRGKISELRSHLIQFKFSLIDDLQYGQNYFEDMLRIHKVNLLMALHDDHSASLSISDVDLFIVDSARVPKVLEKNKNLIEEWLKIIEEIIRTGEIDYKPSGIQMKNSAYGSVPVPRIWIPTNELLIKKIEIERELLNTIEAVGLFNAFSFDSHYSAGQTSLLSFFSRLYTFIKSYDYTENFYLLIDEPEQGFHPEWKRQLFKWLIIFLEQNFPDKKFQLIITTNSPYLLSDLPSDNVVLINKAVGQNHPEMAPSIKTFGANIHELLAHSFFLKDGTIGVFAKEKLESLIQYLQSEDQVQGEWNESTAQNLIEEVGDRIIQYRLKELFDRKFNRPFTIDDEIRKLEERIVQLKQQKRDD